MAWIESHQEIAQHPKTKRLARYLGVSIPDAIGRLHLLWWWSINYAADGDISGFDAEDLADATLWEGEPGAMLDALKEAGFIEASGQIHDWDQYAGRMVDRRRQDAERKRLSRASSIETDRTSTGRPVDVRSPSGVPNTTGPDLTLPDREVTTSPSAPPPTQSSADGGSRVPLVDLSADSRGVLDAWRLAQGLRSPPKLNPTQAAALEEAVADLGSERLKAACTWAAGEGITVLTKAIRGAKTKRQREEQGTNGSNGHAENRQHPGRPGSGTGRAHAGPGAGSAGEDDPFAKYVIRDPVPSGDPGGP